MSILDQPENQNFLSPIGFRFLLQRLPTVQFMVQSVTLPSVVLGEAERDTPFVKIPQPGDHLQYEALSIRYRIDEDMINYKEILSWMEGLGTPYSFGAMRQLVNTKSPSPRGDTFSDGTLAVLSSNNNLNKTITFIDMFPISLSPLQFDATMSDIEYLEADVSFRYQRFTID